jgi:hypothetical protein
MCTTPTKKNGHNRDNPDGRNHVGAPPASHRDDGEEICRIAEGTGP